MFCACLSRYLNQGGVEYSSSRSAIAVDILPREEVQICGGACGLEVVSDSGGGNTTDVWDNWRDVADDVNPNILFVEARSGVRLGEEVDPKLPDPNLVADTLVTDCPAGNGGEVCEPGIGKQGVCVWPVEEIDWICCKSFIILGFNSK